MDYNADKSEWQFKVDHFSRYGLDADDEEPESSGDVPMSQPAPTTTPARLVSKLTESQITEAIARGAEAEDLIRMATDQVERESFPVLSTDANVLPRMLGLDARELHRHQVFFFYHTSYFSLSVSLCVCVGDCRSVVGHSMRAHSPTGSKFCRKSLITLILHSQHLLADTPRTTSSTTS